MFARLAKKITTKMRTIPAVDVLITIPFEPACEMSKWVLDHFDVPYAEEKYVPVIHVFPVLYATRGITKTIIKTASAKGKHWRTNFSVPVLLTRHHNIIHDGSNIVQFVNGTHATRDTTLYTSEEVFRLEKRFCRMGQYATKLSLYFLLRDRLVFNKYLRLNFETQNIQVTVISMFYKRIKNILEWNMQLNRDMIEKALKRIRKEFGVVEERLKDGRKYLMGNEFTAADMVFACMASPVLCVQKEEGFSAVLPHVDELDDEFRSLVNSFRESVAGKFALRLFAEQRSVKTARYTFIKSSL
jgi:glutathione S-transferase